MLTLPASASAAVAAVIPAIATAEDAAVDCRQPLPSSARDHDQSITRRNVTTGNFLSGLTRAGRTGRVFVDDRQSGPTESKNGRWLTPRDNPALPAPAIAQARRLPILEHVSLPEAVTRVLRHRILNNELPADSRLVEANLAAEFNVSRGTIRDAMRSLHTEGLVEIVPRRYSVVTRMSTADAEDVCYARYVLEDASLQGGLGSSRKDLVKALRLALEQMSVAARLNDLDNLVDSDTRFHEVLIDVSGRRRLKDLWSVLNSQMGALMRAELERQQIEMGETVTRHLGIVDAVAAGDLARLRTEVRSHYLMGFPASPA